MICGLLLGMMKKKMPLLALLAGLAFPVFSATSEAFVGNWALTLPHGAAGWLGVEEKDGKLSGSLLWGGGAYFVKEIKGEVGKLVVVREVSQKRKNF